MSVSPKPAGEPSSCFPQRPQWHVVQLPIDVRWEATRRHPFYVTCWRAAAAYYDGDFQPADPIPWESARALRLIGVVSKPPDPSAEFRELEDPDFDVPYSGGSLQPLSFRQMAALLLRHLPPAELAYLGAVFNSAADSEYAIEGDADGEQQRMRAFGHLDEMRSPAYDNCLVAPYYFLHVRASGRTVAKDLEVILARWKKRHKLPPVRANSKKYAQYLRAWDLREGWSGGLYDPSAELPLKTVAKKLRVPLSTAFSAYREGFRLITGHPFDPEKWSALMLPVKAALVADVKKDASPLRPLRWTRSAVPCPVPDSVVTPATTGGEAGSVVESNAVHHPDIASLDFWIDFKDLLDRGFSDEQIARELEIEPAVARYLRSRHRDFHPS